MRGTPSEVLAHFSEHSIRGEFVLLLHGAEPTLQETRDLTWAISRTAQLEKEGQSSKDAMKQAAKEAGLSKRDIYNAMVHADSPE